MKSKMMCTLALLVTGWWTGHALADGNTLLKQCKHALAIVDGGAGKSAFGGGVCLGLIEGTLDGLDLARGYYSAATESKLSPIVCWPSESVTKEQQLRIVVKYLTDHPETLHEAEATSIMLAMMSAFPCANP